MSLIDRAAGTLARRLDNLHGVDAYYMRGSYRIEARVIAGHVREDFAQAQEEFQERQPYEFILPFPEDLVDEAGQKIVPQRGDYLIVDWPEEVRSYEVFPDEQGLCWASVDQRSHMIRVYTKFKG